MNDIKVEKRGGSFFTGTLSEMFLSERERKRERDGGGCCLKCFPECPRVARKGKEILFE